MSKKPYAKSEQNWLVEQEAFLRSVLLAASHHRQNLENMAKDRHTDPHNLLDFAGVAGRDVAIAMAVCDRLMEALGPTAQAMRDELDDRKSKPKGNKRLPIVKN